MPRFEDHPAHLTALRAAALRAADPAAAVRRSLKVEDFAEVEDPARGAERVFLVGAGKAGAAMAQAAAEILGERLTAGVLSVPHLPAEAPMCLRFIEGGHPLPMAGSVAAGQAIADLLSQTTERDLVLALISGGGSALLELPRPGLSLQDFQTTTAALLRCGATIHEFNTLRAQLSQIKGGGLVRLAWPARVLGLIISDVVGNSLETIASGPTVPTTATARDALAVVEKYHLEAVLPAAVMACLTTDDGPQTADRRRSSVVGRPSIENRLIASNRLAGEAAVAAARELGFEATWLGDDWQGEAKEAGMNFAQTVLQKAREQGSRGAGEQAHCFVIGGETTVTVRGHGRGGRNQEAALAAALAIADSSNAVISTFATDGIDGPTGAAGAVVTGETVARARALGLDPQQHLDRNDSYSFFAALGDLIITGPTGTNVNDLWFGLVY